MSDLNLINNLNERGGNLLTHAEERRLVAWLPIPDKKDLWLEITYYQDNYPSLSVSVLTSTEASLAEHITRKFGRQMEWYVSKINLPGVTVEDDHVVLTPTHVDGWSAEHCLDFINDHSLNDEISDSLENPKFPMSEAAAADRLSQLREVCKQYLRGEL